jgi:hypothetical protein
MAEPLAGVVFLTVSGRKLRVVDGATYRTSKDLKESLTGQDGYHGTKSKPVPGRIAANVRDDGSLSHTTIDGWTDETVVLELANGKVVVGRNMCAVEERDVNTEEGSFPLAFEGPDVKD